MDCPRCDEGLSEITLDDLVLDRCGECGGVWFDFAELERLLSKETRTLRHLLPDGEIKPQEEKDSLPCPRCGGTLIRMRTSPGRIIYYGCFTCYGRWLDGCVIERAAGRSLVTKYEKLFRQLFD